MARIETRDEEPPLSAPPVGPPRRDDDLDDWFTRRLAAQGINAGRGGLPIARVVSVIALVIAVVALFWVLKSASGGGSSSASTGTTTHQQTTPNSTGSTGSTGSTTKQTPTYKWNQVKVTVLNGNGTSGAAGTAQTQLESAGWNVVGTGNTTSSATSTIVVYPPSKKLQAEAVATKLGLPAPVAADTVAGVPTDLSTVAIVLGPENLPTTG